MASAFEHVWLTYESAYLTEKASLAVGTSQFNLPLPEANAFQGLATPIFQETMYGGGFAVVREVQYDHQEVKVQFSTQMWASQMAFLLNAAVTRINSGQTSPWTTTEPPGDLASIHAWHVWKDRAGTTYTREYSGGKISRLSGSMSRGNPKGTLKGEIIFSKEKPNTKDSSTAGTPPTAPTEAQYPTGCYLFSNTASGIVAAGGTFTKYESFDFDITNKLDPRFFETSWLTDLVCMGREATVKFKALLKSSPDLNAIYLGLTRGTVTAVWNNGTNTQTLGFLANNYLSELAYDRPLGQVFTQDFTYKNMWDPTANSGAGGDLSVANT